MKSFPSRSGHPAAKDTEDKIKFSKHDLERMIQHEIHSAMKKKEKRLDAQIESLEQGMSYERSAKVLEARMATVVKRAEAALAHMTTVDENATQEIEKLRASNEQLHSINEQLRASNERLCASNEALTASVFTSRGDQADLPIARSQNKVIERLAKLIKKEPESSKNAYSPTASVPLKRPKVEVPSPEDDRPIKRIKAEPEELPDVPLSSFLLPEAATCNLPPRIQEELPYPPLPDLPSTSSSPQAATYTLPSRVQLKLVLIKNPPQLTLIWGLDKEEPLAPPMKSYSVYYTSEQTIGSNVFQNWQNLGEHPAVPFPMFSVIHNYSPGHKICVTVVGKDTFGRYGPYSKVECAVL